MPLYPIELGFGHTFNNRSELEAFIEEEANCAYYESGASMELDVSEEDYIEDYRRDMLKQYGIEEDQPEECSPNHLIRTSKNPCRWPDCNWETATYPGCECDLPELPPEQSGNPGYRPELCCNIANCQSPNCLDIYKGVIDCFPF